MKQKLQFVLAILLAVALLPMEKAEAQFFPHNDTTFTFVSTTNSFGRIQTYDGEDGRYDDFEDKVIDRLYQLIGLNEEYVWNPNDDPDINLVDTVYYAGADSAMYFRELNMDNSWRSDPPLDINVITLVRQFVDQPYGLARLGVINVEDDPKEFKLSVLVRAKIFEVFGGETMEWDASSQRLYLFNDEAAAGIQAILRDPVGVSLMDFGDYDSTDPARDNARDFARWDEMVKTTFPDDRLTAGPDGGWAYMNFGSTGNLATGDSAYVWIAFTHGADLDVVDARLDAAIAKAEELGLQEPTSTPGDFSDIPTQIGLSQNYPNPFNPTTEINFSAPQSGQATLKVYDMLGRQVAELHNGYLSAGTHSVRFDASGLASGVYMYRFEMNGQALTRTMSLIK